LTATGKTVYIQYASDSIFAKKLQYKYRQEGFRAPGIEKISNFKFSTSVRYFHEEDLEAANEALEALKNLVDEENIKIDDSIKPLNLSSAYNNVPKGIIEVWIAGN